MSKTAVGADGLLVEGLATVPNELASTVMYWFAPVMLVIVTAGFDVVAVNVPEVMAIWMLWEAGGAFWCGFHSDGSNQAANTSLPWTFVQAGLKTSLFKYGRFSIPANSLAGLPKLIKVGTLSESH